jgi:hypothetical protein
MSIEEFIRKKEMQSQNTAYTLKARTAIKAEVKQLQEILENNKCKIKSLESNIIRLKEDLLRIKDYAFHLELLVVAIFGIDPIMLRTYMKIYSQKVLIAYLNGTTETLVNCEKWEIEIEKVLNNKNQ